MIEGICSSFKLLLISNISKTEFRLFYPENIFASSKTVHLDETSFS